MPWCPKCKSEYREGFSICADCGSELVDEEQFARMQEEEQARLEAERFAAARAVYMAAAREAGLGTGQTEDMEPDEAALSGIELECAEREESASGRAKSESGGMKGIRFGGIEPECAETGEARPCGIESQRVGTEGAEFSRESERVGTTKNRSTVVDLSDFGLEDAGERAGAGETADGETQQQDAAPETRGAEQGKRQNVSGSAPYRDNAERASENRSSAWVLMVVGGLGIAVLVLGITGVIPLRFGNAYLFYGVMAAIFILFVVAGIVSMKNALKFEKSAESENSVKAALLEWCRQNLRAEELDRMIGAEEGASKEILYFNRFEAIKARLNHQFLNLDQGFLEKLIDDTVYEMVYGEDDEAV